MSTPVRIIRLFALLPALAAHGADHFTNTAYEVAIARDGVRADVIECVSFNEHGRFAMASEPLTMLWTTQVHYPDWFIATTTRADRTIVPYHFALHGKLGADGVIDGSGIDESGGTLRIKGKRNDDCATSAETPVASVPWMEAEFPQTQPWQGNSLPAIPTAGRPADSVPWMEAQSPQTQQWQGNSSPELLAVKRPAKGVPWMEAQFPQTQQWQGNSSPELPAVKRPADSVPWMEAQSPQTQPWQGGRLRPAVDITDPFVDYTIPVLDPCSPVLGAFGFCDPVPNPLRGNNSLDASSALAGGSFRLTLGTSNGRVREYCWKFNSDGSIQMSSSGRMTWTPDAMAATESSFQSIGETVSGKVMAYYGVAVGDNLLQVAGIETRKFEYVSTYGYGERVSACEAESAQ